MSHPEEPVLLHLTRDLTNHVFGDYHVLRRIGSGAMAEVYLAQQQSLGRQVALKILKPELAASENSVKRFVREAKASAQLVHPNIVHIYEVNCVEGIWFIAQEYVQGTNLHAFLKKNGAFSPQQVALILWQTALALQKASQSGIVHRDIKPDNILLSDSGEMKVADFGLAQVGAMFTDEKAALTQTGMTLGTPLYMSPEQAEGKPLDHRSDIYSLGITAYHLLTGSPPFKGDTAIVTALLHLNKLPEPLHSLGLESPPKLLDIVHRMIEKTPDKRYQTLGELLDDLKTLLKESFADNLELPSQENGNGWRTDPGLATPIPLTHFRNSPSVEATRHLEKSMRLEKSVRRKKTPFFFLAVGIVAVLCGMTAALARKQAPLFHFPPPQSGSSVNKMNSIAGQWIFACNLLTEEGWKSVIAFDGSEEIRNRWQYSAWQQLALLYMRTEEMDKAFDIFLTFAEFPDYEPQARSFGYAGLCWYYAKQGNKSMAENELTNFLIVSYDFRSLDEPTNKVFDEAMRLREAMQLREE